MFLPCSLTEDSESFSTSDFKSPLLIVKYLRLLWLIQFCKCISFNYWVILIACQPIRVILYLEVRKSYIYIYIFVLLFLKGFLDTVIRCQVFLSNTNNWLLVVWFHIFLSNANNWLLVVWFHIFLSNANNWLLVVWFHIFSCNANNWLLLVWFHIFLPNVNNSLLVVWFHIFSCNTNNWLLVVWFHIFLLCYILLMVEGWHKYILHIIQFMQKTLKEQLHKKCEYEPMMKAIP